MKLVTRFATTLWVALGLALVFTASVQAQQMKKLGPWHVHYIAFGSTFITPEIARTYKITRAKNKGIINIAILDSKTQEAQSVDITGTVRNLIHAPKPLQFKEINEGESTYYIAQMDYKNEETLTFEIKLRQGSQTQTLKFTETLYID